MASYFNPHTPQRVRTVPPQLIPFRSIDFNPHTPRGVRPRRSSAGGAILPFQSTHPARGATVVSDGHLVPARTFQSTHPARGATPHQSRRLLGPRHISIHTPARGVRLGPAAWRDAQYLFQSTHPARGATGLPVHQYRHTANFNPRTPRGVRPDTAYRPPRCTYFNPRTPRGVRRGRCQRLSLGVDISIHAPREGATDTSCIQSVSTSISIHAPREGCDDTINTMEAPRRGISIHAPRERVRICSNPLLTWELTFQSTHPARVRRGRADVYELASRFQSTHPARGATTGQRS